MMTTAFRGIPPIPASRRREVWLRQLVRKWRGHSNTGSSSINRDMHMDMDMDMDMDRGHVDHRSQEGENFDKLEESSNVNVCKDRVEPGKFESVAAGLPASTHASLVRGQSETLRQQFIDRHQYRVAVHTWNVAGKLPPDDLDLEDWINISQPADIYVFGFQEVVPLNANNVLCVEDKAPAALWEARIRETLNKDIGQQKSTALVTSLSEPPSPRNAIDVMLPDVPEVSDVEGLLAQLTNTSLQGRSTSAASEEVFVHNKNSNNFKQGGRGKRSLEQSASCSNSAGPYRDRVWSAHVGSGTPQFQKEAVVPQAKFLPPISPWYDAPVENSHQYYSRVASKQMAGLFITVWIRSHLWCYVHNVQVSTVGCGLMNHLANKGSISVSMFLHYTSFCFVCSHLTSGHKESDVLRRNADVAEILRRTRFPRLAKLLGLGLPQTILAHDRVIWLGDLNYRLALPDKETWTLVKQGNWAALLRMDQLKLEQGEGRVFPDWQEGPIYFPPTYKYMNGSDQLYSSGDGSTNPSTPGGMSSKRRSPAWCDRVLWYGQGLQQLAYTREDSKLSDHRSVSATFTAEVEVVSGKNLKKACAFPANHAFDVRSNVVPMVKPVVDVHKIQFNEPWSTLLRTLTPWRHKLVQDMEMDSWSDLRGLLDQQPNWVDANEAAMVNDDAPEKRYMRS